MNCRKLLGKAARGEDYSPPKQPLDCSRLMESEQLRAYARKVFHFMKMIPGTLNATIESYQEIMKKIIIHLIKNASDKLAQQNVASDTILHLKEGISFENFFAYLMRYTALAINSEKLQDLIDSIFKTLNYLAPTLEPSTQISLTRPPYKLPLNHWSALINAASDIRPCFVVLGVNTQRAKLFEKILSDMTGALLLDIPSLIQWPLRPESVENAKKNLMKGGYLTYKESKDLILECSKMPAANYRGWIIPTSFHKDGFDFSTLFKTYSEFEQRCFLVDMDASLESLIELAKTRQFDPQDEKIISSLDPSSLLFVQRLKRREFVGREIEEADEEEQEEDEKEEEEDGLEPEETLKLYKAPKYLTPEEMGLETNTLEEEDEAAERIFTLPEESEKMITARFNEHEKERAAFSFQTATKVIRIDATQPLNEMGSIVCDRAAVLAPCVFPDPVLRGEEEDAPDDEEERLSPVGENCVVSLVDEKRTVRGNPGIAVKFYGMKFMFETDEKMRAFAAEPLKYLEESYHTFHHRVLIVGPQLSGKKTLERKLAEFFDSEVTDFDRLVEETRLRIPAKEDETDETEATKEETEETETKDDDTTEDTATMEVSETTTEEPTKTTEEEEKEKDRTKEEEDKKESSKEEEDNKEKEKKQKEPLPPIFENGYVCIMESLNAEALKVFMENEALAPEVVVVLRMVQGEDGVSQELVLKRIESSLEGKGLDPSQAVAMQNETAKAIEKWSEKFAEFQESLGDISLNFQTIDATLPIDEVFWNAAYLADPLLPRCTEPTEEEPAFGYLGPYCPVTLKDKQLLQNGSELTAYFQGANFGFADEACMERFKNAPLAFTMALPAVPPPRILIVGSRGTSKTSIATNIGVTHNAPVYELPSNPKFVPANEEEEEPDPEEVTRQTLEPFFARVLKETDDQRKGWIIEGTPAHPICGTLLLESGLKPDFVINLEHDEKWALMRNHGRLDDDEEILTQEGDDSGTAKDVATTVTEVTAKAEPVVIDTSRRFTSIMEMVNRVLQRELKMRRSLFVSQSATPLEEALEAIKSNQVFVSQFGRYCPVCLQETGALHLTDLSVACSFLGRVFFFETEKHRQLFMDDPLRFVTQLHPPVFPFVPKVSVLGSPELAQRLADSLSAELIRPRDVIARVARHQTTFGAKVRKILATGGAVNAEIFKQALSAVLARQDCQVRGYVLDGYPLRLAELLEMRGKGIMPQDIVVVKGDEQLVRHAIENFHNVIEIAQEPTVWMQLIKATNRLNYNMRLRWEALLAMDEKRSYCISPLDVSPEEIQSGLTAFEHYCPVSLSCDEVSIESAPNDWDNIVRHEGKYYHMKDSHSRNVFLTSPIPFVTEWAPREGVAFAKPGKSDNAPEVEGYDIIDLNEGRFVKGDASIAATYLGKLYLFKTEEHRNEFCAYTSRYTEVTLPAHRPVDAPATMKQTGLLSTVPFLEQCVGDVVTECIVELTKRRPKIPGKTFEVSMNEYVAAYVRANSPGVGPLLHERFGAQLEEVNELVGLAAKLKASLETPIEMRDEAEHERLCALWKEHYKPN